MPQKPRHRPRQRRRLRLRLRLRLRPRPQPNTVTRIIRIYARNPPAVVDFGVDPDANGSHPPQHRRKLVLTHIVPKTLRRVKILGLFGFYPGQITPEIPHGVSNLTFGDIFGPKLVVTYFFFDSTRPLSFL